MVLIEKGYQVNTQKIDAVTKETKLCNLLIGCYKPSDYY